MTVYSSAAVERLERELARALDRVVELETERVDLAKALDALRAKADRWVQHDTEAYAAQSMRALRRAGAAEARAELLRAALEDARSFAVSIKRNEGGWESRATGLLSRIDGSISQANALLDEKQTDG